MAEDDSPTGIELGVVMNSDADNLKWKLKCVG